jgi:hypothetical protein
MTPEENGLVYDHVDGGAELHIDRESNEEDESYRRRLALYGSLFGRRSRES